MTASRYQSAESGSCAAAGSVRTSGEVIEASVRSPVYTEDMRGKLVRVELDVVAPAGPFVLRAAEEVVHLEALAGRDVEGQLHPAGLGVLRIEVDHHQDDVLAGLLGVGHQLVIV